MAWLIIVVTVLAACFGGVLLFGAPYLPTLRPQVQAALKLSGLKAGDHLLELGCGDGKVMLAAARQGIKVTGYELNPLLVIIARIKLFKYRRTTRVIWGDMWRAEWPEAQAIFVFLLSSYMPKLNKKVIQYKHKPVKLVSFAFKIEGRRVSREQDGVFLYQYQ